MENRVPILPGLTWKEAQVQCPPGIIPACHNSASTVTISGPVADVASFVVELKGRGVFAREVNSAGVAFHSKDMNKVAPLLLLELEKVVRCEIMTFWKKMDDFCLVLD